MPLPVVLAASWTSGFIMKRRASTRDGVSSLSMGMGLGPTPILQQAAPQKGWSPKKGTTVVGQPAIKPAVPERFCLSSFCTKAIRQSKEHMLTEELSWQGQRQGQGQGQGQEQGRGSAGQGN